MALIARPDKIVQVDYPETSTKRFSHVITNRYASKPRYQQPCPIDSYRMESWKIASSPSGSWAHLPADQNNIWSGGNWNSRFNSARAQSLNKAYERFKSAVGEKAELGINLAERKQAVTMIVNRLTTLRLGYLDLRKGRFGDFLKRFRLRDRQRGRRTRWSRPKDASNLWLEYHFGWSPLLNDVYSACQIMQAPFDYDWPAKGRGSDSETISDPPTAYARYVGVFKSHTHMQARVTVVNPNLYRATQLGLTNPAAIAWELIPFSFLVDWFIPVSSFLNSWSDFFGLQFDQAFTTSYDTFEGTVTYYNGFPYWSDHGLSCVTLHRDLALAKPVIYPKRFKGFSVTRGATAIALLLAVFKP